MAWMVRFSVAEGASELVSSLLWDAGTTGIAESGDHLLAGFDTRPAADEVCELAARWPARVVGVEPVEWAGTDEVTTVVVGDDELSITAGPTFGHGGHPTTALAIDLLTTAVLDRPRSSGEIAVLDVGVGSGVLAIAAATLGAGPVVGVDIDPATIAVAEANAAANGAEISVFLDEVGVTPERIGGRRFDIVVANVLLPTQRQLAPAMASVLAPGGSLVTSGYLIDDGAAVVAVHLDAIGGPAQVRGQEPGRRGMVVAERQSGPWAAHRFDVDQVRPGA